MDQRSISIDRLEGDGSETRTIEIEPSAQRGCSADDPAVTCDEEDLCAGTPTLSSLRGDMVVCGESAGVPKRSSVVVKKVSPSASVRTNRNRESHLGGGNQSAHVVTDRRASRSGEEVDIRELLEQLRQSRQELAHTKEERDEIQMAFRRLDQEITNGYNLAERKEKEMKIADLITKNRKLSQIIETELKKQEAFRAMNTDLLDKLRQLEESYGLQKQVLVSVETKYMELVESNSRLSASYAAAQDQIASFQIAMANMETELDNLALQRGENMEEKIQAWESKCVELQRQLDGKSIQLRAEYKKSALLECKIERLVEEKASLKAEVLGAHEKVIKMEGTMKSVDAKREVPTCMTDGSNYRLNQIVERVRLLEDELFRKSRLFVDQKGSIDKIFSKGPVNRMGVGSNGGSSRHVNSHYNQSDSGSSRVVSLSQRLRKVEDSRDHKVRCLDILMRMLPQLLQQLDAIQDKFFAAEESVVILSSAVDQLQGGDQIENPTHKSSVALAREAYILSGPYQPDLLVGYTMSRAFSEIEPPPPKKQPKFFPFLVRTRVNISGDSSDSKGQLLLAADEDDPNGVVFLNRCKINAFLHLVQGDQVKCKHLLVKKIAELLSIQRELSFQHSIESTYYKAAIAKRHADGQQCSLKLHQLETELERFHHFENSIRNGDSTRTRLLTRLVEAIIGESCSMQNTFFTQFDCSVSSDCLVPGKNQPGQVPVKMDFSDCGILDDEIESLLVKLSVCAPIITELNLSGNQITDCGVASLGAFLETRPESLRVVNLQRNHQITPDGLAVLIRGLTTSSVGQRVDVDKVESKIVASVAGEDFDTAGRPTELLSIYLPEQAISGASLEQEQDTKVQELIDLLESRGYCGSATNSARARTAYLQTSLTSKKKTGARQLKAKPRVKTSSSQSQSQREMKFRALEEALRHAEVSVAVPVPGGRTRGVSLTHMKRLLEQPVARSSSPTIGTPLALSHQRLSKLRYAQSHLATIRGLGQK